MFSKGFFLWVVNSLPHMPILGSSNSAAKKKKKRYNVKNMDKWGYNYLTEEKNIVGRGEIARYEQFLLLPRCCLLLMRKNEYL